MLARMLVIPGSHDVNIVRFKPDEPSWTVALRLEGKDRVYRKVILVRMMACLPALNMIVNCNNCAACFPKHVGDAVIDAFAQPHLGAGSFEIIGNY